MTRKDFNLIAGVVRSAIERESGMTAQSEARRDMARDIAGRFATELQATNSGFDVARFLEACGV